MHPSPTPTRYFDYNATTPVLAEAVDAMQHALVHGWGNPSSSHWAGRQARALVERARSQVAALVGATDRRVVFTSGATESLAIALRSVGSGRVVASAVEHPALFDNAHALPGRDVVSLALGEDLALDVAAAVDRAGVGGTVALMAANNVTGVCQPVDALCALASVRGVATIVDAVQLAGKAPISCRPDFLVLAAHKLGGPKGIGALVAGADVELQPVVYGGGQEGGARAGTEPVPAIVGFGAACEVVLRQRDVWARDLRKLRDHLETRLVAELPGTRFVGQRAPRLPNTSAIILPPGSDASATLTQLDAHGFAVSAGSACHAGRREPSPVLMAHGLTPDESLRVLRVSLGPAHDLASVNALIAAIIAVAS